MEQDSSHLLPAVATVEDAWYGRLSVSADGATLNQEHVIPIGMKLIFIVIFYANIAADMSIPYR